MLCHKCQIKINHFWWESPASGKKTMALMGNVNSFSSSERGCEKTFLRNDNLYRHLKNEHGVDGKNGGGSHFTLVPYYTITQTNRLFPHVSTLAVMTAKHEVTPPRGKQTRQDQHRGLESLVQTSIAWPE